MLVKVLFSRRHVPPPDGLRRLGADLGGGCFSASVYGFGWSVLIESVSGCRFNALRVRLVMLSSTNKTTRVAFYAVAGGGITGQRNGFTATDCVLRVFIIEYLVSFVDRTCPA